MKSLYSGWSVLALVLGANSLPACSSDPGSVTSTDHPTASEPGSKVGVSSPTTPTGAVEGRGTTADAPADTAPAAAAPPSVTSPSTGGPATPAEPTAP
ncbi:MAG TPA: hypothetical protein VHU80_11860, partial [Polyangiaceae bacterium]|nr:hypothetical protein [Polyangiaceae bacterium]